MTRVLLDKKGRVIKNTDGIGAINEPNLIPENIKKDINILGVTGTFEGLEPTKSWYYVTEHDSDGYPIKAKTLNCSGGMPYIYMYASGHYQAPNMFTRFLQEFEINDGVTNIGDYAFYNCALQSIKIPNSVTSIGANAFYYCSKLTSIIIPDSVTSIGNYAFFACTGLKNIIFGSGVTRIESETFQSCYNCLLFDFRKATQVPTLSGTNAFYNTSSSKKIVVPDALYDEWITATNWSSTSYNIVTSIIKASEYEASL